MGITCHIIIQYGEGESKTEGNQELVAAVAMCYNETICTRWGKCQMPNGRKIFDITYYLVKRKNALNCTHCGKRLPAGTELYAKESRNGRLVVCRECVMRLSDQYQNETYGRIPFLREEPLYGATTGSEPLLEGNVYSVGTPDELLWIASNTNSGNTFSGYTIEITDDIDLGNSEWISIGYNLNN